MSQLHTAGSQTKGEGHTVKAITSYIILLSLRAALEFLIVTANYITTETSVISITLSLSSRVGRWWTWEEGIDRLNNKYAKI